MLEPDYVFSRDEILTIIEEKNLFLASYSHFYDQLLSFFNPKIDSVEVIHFLNAMLFSEKAKTVEW